jgi:hypothetical protein
VKRWLANVIYVKNVFAWSMAPAGREKEFW